MAGHLLNLLRAFVRQGSEPLAAVAITSAPEQAELRRWSQAAPAEAPEAGIAELFTAQAARTPHAIAVETESGPALTYAALQSRVDRLAAALRARGAAPEQRIGVCVSSPVARAAAWLGVLRSGAVYVPLDPSAPASRLAWILADAEVSLVVVEPATREHLPADIAMLDADPAEETGTAESSLASPWSVRSQQAAYVIYTSGSTGRPKGVVVTQGSLSHRLYGTGTRYGANEQSVMPCLAPYGFDIALFELGLMLLHGGRVVMLEERAGLSAEQLKPVLARSTHLHAVPSLMQQIMGWLGQAEWAGVGASLGQVFVGGERVSGELLEELRKRIPQAGITALYGPTETTIICAAEEEGSGGSAAWLGQPLPHSEIHVLDRWGQPVPVEVPGELYVGGAGVARGYLHRPDHTAASFVPHPWGAAGTRLYRTGDRACWTDTGKLVFLGRIDEQVKIRGYRVEPGEVTAVLRQHPAVQDAVVVARADHGEALRLAAYVVRDYDGLTVSALRGWMQERVPEYLLPAAWVWLEALPLTAHGKLDRAALPATDGSRPELQGAYEAPATEAERLLAGVWESVLGRAPIGRHDNFFELGGDSILSIQIVARAQQAGLRFTPKHIFEHPTVAGLAAVATPAAASGGWAEAGSLSGPVPLTPIQKAFLEEQTSHWHHCNQSALLRPRHPLSIGPLSAAVARLVEHHDALRLRLEKSETGWRQYYAEREPAVVCGHMDLQQAPESLTDAAAQVQASLDLSHGPLIQVVLMQLGPQEQRLLIVVHHLAIDAVSWRILLDDLERAYRKAAKGEAIDLPAKSSSYRQWAEALERSAAARPNPAELAYWQAEAQTSPLPHDGEAAAGASPAHVRVTLPAATTQALLQEVPAAYHTQIQDVLLTALGAALGEWSGHRQVRVDVEGHGRHQEVVDARLDLTRTVGWFTTVSPVRLPGVGAAGWGERLKQVKEHLRERPGQGLGYGIARYLRKEESVPGLGEIAFNYLGQWDTVLEKESWLEAAEESAGPATSRYYRRPHPLEIVAQVAGGELQMAWIYAPELYRGENIERVAEECRAALEGIIAHCQSPEAGGYTPSDFPLAQLSQQDLDTLIAHLPA
jgi:amino acid adenylation domain-containing protein/non-ribosomal peptide synthase protein (TIGR01720 family)